LSEEARARLNGTALTLVLLVFLQLIWGSIVRHNPTPLMQRLHLFTAFAVVAVAVWSILSAQSIAGAAERMHRSHTLLGMFLVAQVVLGIEAWMGKFASGTLPDTQMLTTEHVIIRGLHVLVGTAIFATAVVLLLQTKDPTLRVEQPRRCEEERRDAGELVASTQ
jgi:hypothetical protein